LSKRGGRRIIREKKKGSMRSWPKKVPWAEKQKRGWKKLEKRNIVPKVKKSKRSLGTGGGVRVWIKSGRGVQTRGLRGGGKTFREIEQRGGGGLIGKIKNKTPKLEIFTGSTTPEQWEEKPVGRETIFRGGTTRRAWACWGRGRSTKSLPVYGI